MDSFEEGCDTTRQSSLNNFSISTSYGNYPIPPVLQGARKALSIFLVHERGFTGFAPLPPSLNHSLQWGTTKIGERRTRVLGRQRSGFVKVG